MVASESCVVTGAASGIGRAVAELLIGRGWLVVGVDRDESALAASAESLGMHACVGDVVERETSERAAATAAALAPMTGWVNNAGIELLQPATDLDADSVRRQLDVNVVGTVWGCSVAARAMQGAGGSIVNLSSIQARVPLPKTFVYSATKGAVSSLTRQLAIDYAAQGIRCNAVLPGAIDTPLNRSLFAAAADPGAAHAREAWLSPMGRLGDPAEVAEAVCWLLSPASSFVTGHELVVDGGATARLVSSYPGTDA